MNDIAGIMWGTWAQTFVLLGLLVLLAVRLPPKA